MLSVAVQNAANEQALFTLGAMLILARRWYQRCFPITALAVPNFTVLCQRLNRCLHASLHVLFTQRRFSTPRSDQTLVARWVLHPLHTSSMCLRRA